MSVRKNMYSYQLDLTVLIKEIKKRQFIWNTEDEQYNDRGKNSLAWAEISQLMQTPEDVLRAKWKNLRDLFRREMKKYTPVSKEDYSGKWRYFHLLWFLHRRDDIENDDDENSSDDGTETKNEECFIKIEPENQLEVFVDNDDDILVKKRPNEEPVAKHVKKIKTDEDDFDMMFLKSLTPYFRALAPLRKLVIRNKIQQILFNELALVSDDDK